MLDLNVNLHCEPTTLELAAVVVSALIGLLTASLNRGSRNTIEADSTRLQQPHSPETGNPGTTERTPARDTTSSGRRE